MASPGSSVLTPMFSWTSHNSFPSSFLPVFTLQCSTEDSYFSLSADKNHGLLVFSCRRQQSYPCLWQEISLVLCIKPGIFLVSQGKQIQNMSFSGLLMVISWLTTMPKPLPPNGSHFGAEGFVLAPNCKTMHFAALNFFWFLLLQTSRRTGFFPCLKGGNFLCPHPNSSTQCVSSKALLYVRGERQNTFILVINRNPNKLYFLDRGWRKLCGNSPFILLKWIAIRTLQMKRYVHITDPSKGMCEQRHKDALYVKEAPEAHIPLLCMSLNHELQCHLTESPSGLLILSPILDRPSFHLYAWHL